MLVIDVEWVPFCEDGWTATDGKNEHAFLLKVDGKWHVGIARQDNAIPYDTFESARRHVLKHLGIDPHPRRHLQALFGHGYRRS